MKSVKLFSVMFLTLAYSNFSEAMTKSQLNNAVKLMKNVCMPKNKVTNEQVQNINKGDFQDDPNVKCYIACVYTVAQTIKNGKFNYESAMKQIDLMFPDDMKAGGKAALNNCKNVAKKTTDICQGAFEISKCLYEYDPKNFIFP